MSIIDFFIKKKKKAKKTGPDGKTSASRYPWISDDDVVTSTPNKRNEWSAVEKKGGTSLDEK